MRKIDKKIKKTTTLVKKIVKKVAPKMLIKAKVKPRSIVKSKSQPKMVSKAKSVVGGQAKAKVVAKTKDKIKIPVKLSVGGKNKTKEIVAKKAITSIKIKKASLSVGPRKIEKTGSRGLASSPRDDKILQHKTKKVIKATQKPVNKVVPSKTKKVIKVIQKPVNQVVPSKTKKVIKVIQKPANQAAPSKTKKIIKAIKKVDKINMSHTNKPKKSDNLSPVVDKPYSSNTEEQYMNEQQITHFKKILLEWKEGLMESVDSTMHHMQDEAANYPDPVDRASQEEGFSLELRTRDRERKLLKKIDETLLRISEQDYGYCDDCGAEIGIRRLEARPTANQCIECKTIAEIREKQIGEIN